MDIAAGVSTRDTRVVVIGGGMSGVLMGIRLKRMGIANFTIYEKGSTVGGTWRENSYPGLHCDVPSQHYCYSFDPNPDWSHEYSCGPEIRGYFERSATKFGIMPHIEFNTAVTAGRWVSGKWHITLSSGETTTADILISAVGVLHVPVYPDIPGRQDFAGQSFHSTRWNHEVPLHDKRIGVIGTGSTAVQIVAALGGNVRHLSMFQRTAQWVARVPNPAYSDLDRARYGRYPFLLDWHYERNRRLLEKHVIGGIMGYDDAIRAALIKNCEDNLASVKDPALRQKLTPNYAVGCKRLVSSPNFYEAIQHRTSELITEPIERIVPEGIITEDGRLHEFDVIAYATGFNPLAYVRPMTLVGRGGRTLEEVWSKRPIAYHSMSVPHMPNFFMLEGPFSPFGNLSLVLISEWQAEYITKCIDKILSRRIAMSPTVIATEQIMARYRAGARNTIWAKGGCKSWYLDEEGVPIVYPFVPSQFREETLVDPPLEDFEIEPLPASAG